MTTASRGGNTELHHDELRPLVDVTRALLVPGAMELRCGTLGEAVRHPALGRFARRSLAEEILPALAGEGTADAGSVTKAVLDLVEASSAERAPIDDIPPVATALHERVTPIVAAYHERTGLLPEGLAFGFAAFLLVMDGRYHLAGRLDARVTGVQRAWHDVEEDADPGVVVDRVFRDEANWGGALAVIPGFADAVTDHLRHARRHGLAAALERHLVT